MHLISPSGWLSSEILLLPKVSMLPILPFKHVQGLSRIWFIGSQIPRSPRGPFNLKWQRGSSHKGILRSSQVWRAISRPTLNLCGRGRRSWRHLHHPWQPGVSKAIFGHQNSSSEMFFPAGTCGSYHIQQGRSQRPANSVFQLWHQFCGTTSLENEIIPSTSFFNRCAEAGKDSPLPGRLEVILLAALFIWLFLNWICGLYTLSIL